MDHSEAALEAAHERSANNREEVERSFTCHCFHCLSSFAPSEIDDWWGTDEATAVCPRCGIDSVIGDASAIAPDHAFLEAMHERWFERTVDEDDPRYEELFGASYTGRERFNMFLDRFRRRG